MALSHRLDTCWLCGEPMDESKEHVLPESITYGGSLRVSGFICTRCNNITGTEWDAALVVSQLWNQKGKGGEVWFGHPGC